MFVRNVVLVIIKGVELEIQVNFMDNLNFRVIGGYLDVEYDEYIINGVDVVLIVIL